MNFIWTKMSIWTKDVHMKYIWTKMFIWTTYECFSVAATKICTKWENCNFEIVVIFYHVKETLWKFLCILFGCVRSQIYNLRANKNFPKNLKIVRKLGKTLNLPDFRTTSKFFGNFFCSQIKYLTPYTAK